MQNNRWPPTMAVSFFWGDVRNDDNPFVCRGANKTPNSRKPMKAVTSVPLLFAQKRNKDFRSGAWVMHTTVDWCWIAMTFRLVYLLWPKLVWSAIIHRKSSREVFRDFENESKVTKRSTLPMKNGRVMHCVVTCCHKIVSILWQRIMKADLSFFVCSLLPVVGTWGFLVLTCFPRSLILNSNPMPMTWGSEDSRGQNSQIYEDVANCCKIIIIWTNFRLIWSLLKVVFHQKMLILAVKSCAAFEAAELMVQRNLRRQSCVYRGGLEARRASWEADWHVEEIWLMRSCQDMIIITGWRAGSKHDRTYLYHEPTTCFFCMFWYGKRWRNTMVFLA